VVLKAKNCHRQNIDNDFLSIEKFGLFANFFDAGEVHLQHHGIGHQPDEDGHGDCLVLK